jgi:sugar phosphate isomerase/epimerase
MPPTQEEFDKSLVDTRERMRRCAAVGAQHVAAIPAPDRENFDIDWAVKCYKELLRIGREEYGIIVAFEFVGFMKGIHNFGVAAGVAIDTDDSDACLIMDTFHMYRGCSGYNGLKHINGSLIANFHWNDLPAEPEREKLGDEHRIYPGDGMLPLKQVLKDLVAIGYTGPLSIEMFNREHWAQDPLLVANTAKAKTCALIKEALA